MFANLMSAGTLQLCAVRIRTRAALDLCKSHRPSPIITYRSRWRPWASLGSPEQIRLLVLNSYTFPFQTLDFKDKIALLERTKQTLARLCASANLTVRKPVSCSTRRRAPSHLFPSSPSHLPFARLPPRPLPRARPRPSPSLTNARAHGGARWYQKASGSRPK